MSKRSQYVLIALTLLLITLPYLFAESSAGDEFVFNGFLLNPLDGNSYLAKMRQGWLGDWQFTLPFSAEESHGSYLFLFYLFLGHAARWLGLSLTFTFHAARLAASILLCLALARFVRSLLGQREGKAQTIAYALCLFGSGFGWLAAFFGGFTSDFWVAEAYPFLSMYSNPHFPLGMALVLDFFVDMNEQRNAGKWWWTSLKGLFLAIIMPFGVVLAAVITVIMLGWDLLERERSIRLWPAGFIIPGVVFLIYQVFVISSDPLLTLWNAQNLTPSPPLWDLLLSTSPSLIAAIIAVRWMVVSKSVSRYRLLIIWASVGILLAYIPFQLQRRFLFGYFIPLACLATLVLVHLMVRKKTFSRIIQVSFFSISIFTNLLILAGGVGAIGRHDPKLFYPQDMQSAFDWMLSQEQRSPLILASADTGLLIPGATGWRVLYGHPYETPNAELWETRVESVFNGEIDSAVLDELITSQGIDYLYYGPNEQAGGGLSALIDNYPLVFSQGTVQIYKMGPNP